MAGPGRASGAARARAVVHVRRPGARRRRALRRPVLRRDRPARARSSESVGLARAKVERELKLIQGQQPAEDALRPRIHYRFLEQQDSGRDRRGFLYELTISFDGGEQLQRRALVTVREEDGAWHAVNFLELD